jgi:hypothetical protein
LTKTEDILWVEWTTPGRCKNLMLGSTPRRRVWSTWSEFVGGTGSNVQCVAENPHGGRTEGNCGAQNASVRPPQPQGRYSKVPASPFGHGSWRCGM